MTVYGDSHASSVTSGAESGNPSPTASEIHEISKAKNSTFIYWESLPGIRGRGKKKRVPK